MLSLRLQLLISLNTLLMTVVSGQDLENQYGILVVEPDTDTDTPSPDNQHLFCVVYYPSIKNVSEKQEAVKYSLSSILDLVDTNTCDEEAEIPGVENRFGYINGSSSLGNCSITERAQLLQRNKAVGLISDRVISNKFNGSSEVDISIEVLTLVERNAKDRLLEFQKSYPEGVFYVYENGNDEKSFDLSLVVILVMAVMTVILGSFWSGHAKQNLRLKKERDANVEVRDDDQEDCIQPQDGSGGNEEELSIHVSPFLVLFFVFCMCSMLVLLYFFFNQLGENTKLFQPTSNL